MKPIHRIHSVLCPFICLLMAVFALMITPALSVGQDDEGEQEEPTRIWEFSPYQVRVWVALDHSAVMAPQFVDRVCERIEWSAEQVDLSGWRVDAEAAPVKWRQRQLDSLEQLELPEEQEELNELIVGDKLMFVSVKHDHQHYRVSAREFDCRTRLFGPLITETTYQQQMVPHLAYRCVAAAFVPLLRIEEVNTTEATAVARIRAGGFHTGSSGFGSSAPRSPTSPVEVTSSDILMPLVRKNDNSGSLAGGTIRQIEWTYLTTFERDGVVLRCQIHSAVRAPLGGRTSRLTEKLALVVRPQQTETRLVLESRSDPPVRLPGYEIHIRRPEEQVADFSGKSDWDGSYVLERNDAPLQIVYVRSGNRPLAALPIVPGQFHEVSAAMSNDSVRRRAEGVIRGLEAEFMIIVAKRELLAARVSLNLAKGELEKAEELAEELRQLPSAEQFQAKLNSQERGLATNDRRERDRIERMFNQLRLLASQNLAKDVLGPVRAELQEYRKGEFGASGTEE